MSLKFDKLTMRKKLVFIANKTRLWVGGKKQDLGKTKAKPNKRLEMKSKAEIQLKIVSLQST